MQADLVWAAAQRNMPKEVQKDMLANIKQGEQDKAKKTAMKQLRVEYMDTYDYQRFMQWWSDEAVPKGQTAFQALETMSLDTIQPKNVPVAQAASSSKDGSNVKQVTIQLGTQGTQDSQLAGLAPKARPARNSHITPQIKHGSLPKNSLAFCHRWAKTGTCPRGNNCKYGHTHINYHMVRHR